MIKVVDVLPKSIERVALEEYYKEFSAIDGINLIWNRNLKYTADESKHTKKENNDQEFQKALEAIKPKDELDKFILCGDEEQIVAVANVHFGIGYIGISNAIFFTYPDEEEVTIIVNEIAEYLKSVAEENNFRELVWEAFKGSEELVAALQHLGFTIDPNNDRNYRTYLAILNVRERKESVGQNLSRKQAAAVNQ